MGLFSRKPKIKIQTTKKDSFSGWLKCTHCSELIHSNELSQNLNCCPKCDYHYRLTAEQRITLLSDANSYNELYKGIKSVDPLQFVDTKPYKQRLQEAEEQTNSEDAVCVGTCTLEGRKYALGVMDFNFMAGSMGSVVGEKLTLLIEHAIAQHLPLVIVTASGGARMQESILSLMQMAKTSAALSKLEEAKLPYISILTNPTSGGVTASFASLGDIIIAEPKALICFAGPRVVEQTLNSKLPEDAQKSEFLLKHGMIDCIIPRQDLKSKLAYFFDLLCDNQRFESKKKPSVNTLHRSPKTPQHISVATRQTHN